MRKIKAILAIFLVVGLSCCAKASNKKVVHVGVDPSFFPLELLGNEPAVLGFTNELLQEISKVEGYHFERTNLAWDEMLEALAEKKVQAIVTSMYPYVFNLKKYAFSDLFLQTGPVLVVPIKSSIRGFGSVRSNEVAVLSEENEQILLKMAPDAIPRMTMNLAKTLDDVQNEVFPAAFVDKIPARGYVTDLYEGKLKIVTEPKGRMGLRFVANKGENERYVKAFDAGLNKLMRSGKYREIVEKWKI